MGDGTVSGTDGTGASFSLGDDEGCATGSGRVDVMVVVMEVVSILFNKNKLVYHQYALFPFIILYTYVSTALGSSST